MRGTCQLGDFTSQARIWGGFSALVAFTCPNCPRCWQVGSSSWLCPALGIRCPRQTQAPPPAAESDVKFPTPPPRSRTPVSGGRAGLGPSVLGFAGGPGWTMLLHMGTHKTALGTPTRSQLRMGVHRGTEHLHPDDTWLI